MAAYIFKCFFLGESHFLSNSFQIPAGFPLQMTRFQEVAEIPG